MTGSVKGIEAKIDKLIDCVTGLRSVDGHRQDRVVDLGVHCYRLAAYPEAPAHGGGSVGSLDLPILHLGAHVLSWQPF